MWITGCGILHYIAQFGLACGGCDSKSAFDVRYGVISEFIRAKKKKKEADIQLMFITLAIPDKYWK